MGAAAGDVSFALAILLGKIDRSDPTIPTRLALVKAHNLGISDLRHLISRATVAHATALALAPRIADQAYLRACTAGGVSFLDDDVLKMLDPIYARHETDPEMMALFSLAADAFAEAAVAVTTAALVGDFAISVIERVRRRARNT